MTNERFLEEAQVIDELCELIDALCEALRLQGGRREDIPAIADRARKLYRRRVEG